MAWKWFISLFGGDQAGWLTSVHSVQITSWLPLWLFPFLVATLAGGAWWRYRTHHPELKAHRRLLLVTLRTLAWVSLLLMLMLPAFHLEGEGIQKGVVPVVIDASRSMSIRDASGKERLFRAMEMVDALRETSRRTKREMEPVFLLYKNGLGQLNDGDKTTATGDFTSLPQMLEKAAEKVQDQYCPGVLVLTDGAHNTVELPERTADWLKKRRIPLYAVGFGSEKVSDVAVTNIVGEDVLFQEEKTQMYVTVHSTAYVGRQVTLDLRLDGENVASQEVKLEQDGDQQVPVEFTPRRKGRFLMEAKITPLAGEITHENNQFVKNVRVIDEKLRVLLVFGRPSWEFRYLAGAFERDRRVEMRVFLGALDRRGQGATMGGTRYLDKLPTTREELNRSYDVIILSRFHPLRDAPPGFCEAVEEYVKEDSGGLVVLSDPELLPQAMRGTPFEAMLPVVLADGLGRGYNDELLAPLKTEFNLELTEEGMLSPLVTFEADRILNHKTWSEFPKPFFVYQPKKVKPSAMVLVQASPRGEFTKRPVLAHQLYGKGPVLYMGFDSTWRWRREFGDRYFRDFWAKAVQFVGLPHLLGESTRSQLYTANENVVVGEVIGLRARLHNVDLTPTIAESVTAKASENGVDREIKMLPVTDSPGLYRAEYVPEAVGPLHIELPAALGARPLDLRVSAIQREFQNPGLNRPLLESLCRITDGAYFAEADATAAWNKILANRPPLQFTLDFTLWDAMGLLVISLLLYSFEWLLRKLSYLD